MGEYKIIDVKESIFADNNAQADKLRKELKDNNKVLINLMSSPGSGKTTTLCRTIKELRDKVRLGVMEADIDGDVDADSIEKAGAKTIQLHTGGMCHLDCSMVRQGIEEIGIDDLDLIFIENVGNLVCPAEFDTGATKNIMILSVPEGDDKPLKYPLIFQVCDLVLVNKIDARGFFNFDLDRFKENVRMRNKNAVVIPISAKTGEGMEEWYNWLLNNI